ncbi:MAG: DUF1801 domain-containing protein [Flavobacteriaceae bacterium]|nr:DUF1801 domain-containing protein [Flavobacteriaceae bacterium]MCB0475499.1 DUF1801 domain-containing protein [Flavobacteriaceae bacterium]
MTSNAKTPDEYMDQLPEERKAAIGTLRKQILDNIPAGFEETMSYGMIGYVVPHKLYPQGYHCDPKLPLPFMNIASQKNFIAVYSSAIYADKQMQDWFVSEYPRHCKYKMDMGKSCIRFKRLDDIPYELIGELASKMTVSEWIRCYENSIKK